MDMKREPKLTFAVVMFNCVALLGCSNGGLVVCVCQFRFMFRWTICSIHNIITSSSNFLT